ncbi:MAG: RidA family protein [Rhizobiales bacterium]|nr:RidA family protein [Hyphomicrobiales bacterium]
MSGAPIQVIRAPDVPEPPPGLFSNCIVVGDTIHVSGQHAGTTQGVVGGTSVLEQSREALRRVLTLIKAAGGTANDVVKLNVYLCNMDHRADVSTARREVFTEPMPCSTLVGVSSLVSPDLLVEIEAVAVVGHGGRTTKA